MSSARGRCWRRSGNRFRPRAVAICHRGVRPSGHRRNSAVLIATAAVADWRPAKRAARKLKKSEMSGTLKLVRNPDVLKTVKGVRKIGFAAETNDVLAEAVRKCREKKLEFIVANDVTQKGSGFGTDTDKVTFVFADGTLKFFPLMTKVRVAKRILDEVSRL